MVLSTLIIGDWFTQEGMQDYILQKKDDSRTIIDQDTGCWLFPSPQAKDSDGYLRCGIWSKVGKKEKKTMLVHRVAYFAAHGEDLLETGSHLCGVKNCFNPEHIADESQAINNSRKNCPSAVMLCRHGAEISPSQCQHRPKCIRVLHTRCCFDIEKINPPQNHIIRGNFVRSTTLHIDGSLPPLLSGQPLLRSDDDNSETDEDMDIDLSLSSELPVQEGSYVSAAPDNLYSSFGLGADFTAPDTISVPVPPGTSILHLRFGPVNNPSPRIGPIPNTTDPGTDLQQ